MNTNTVKFTDIDKALATQAERIAALEAENARLRTALRHFANLDNWIAPPNISIDCEPIDCEPYDSFTWIWNGVGELEEPVVIAQDALGEYPVYDENEEER